jgi:hypothetical protein
MDSNEFLNRKIQNLVKVFRHYANRVESNDSVTDKYFNLLADSLESILLMKIEFSEKIKALEFVIHHADHSGIIGLAREYIELAIEQAVGYDKNEVKQ